MRDLTEMKGIVAHEIARRHFEKRAKYTGLAGVAGVAYRTPQHIQDGVNTYNDVWKQLEGANTAPLGSPVHGVKHAANPASSWPPLETAAMRAHGFIPSPPDHFTQAPEAPPSFLSSLKDSLLGSTTKGLSGGVASIIGEGFKRLIAPVPQFMERKDIPATLGQQAINAFGKGVSEAGVDLLKDMASKAYSAIAHAGDESARKAILEQLRAEDHIIAGGDDKELMEAYHTMVRFAPTLSTDKNAVRNFLREAVSTGSGPNFATIKMLGETERIVTGKGKGKD